MLALPSRSSVNQPQMRSIPEPFTLSIQTTPGHSFLHSPLPFPKAVEVKSNEHLLVGFLSHTF